MDILKVFARFLRNYSSRKFITQPLTELLSCHTLTTTGQDQIFQNCAYLLRKNKVLFIVQLSMYPRGICSRMPHGYQNLQMRKTLT